MPAIEVRNLHKGFGDNKVLKDVSFRVEDGEYVIVLGPSGCGKTTLLKTIAGIHAPDSGSVSIGGADVTKRPPEERDIGFFFQHYSLFPHMSVRENVAYSLTVTGAEESGKKAAVDDKLRLVGLSEWGGHMPHELSGGMQQRVALARALAAGSKLLLLDEPLNALDAKIASILRGKLKEMSRELGLTVLHVTPNQEEAMELADKIILLKDGRIEQYESDVESYLRPRTPYAAYFIGETNFLRAHRVSQRLVSHHHSLFNVNQDVVEEEVILAVRAEKIRFEEHEHNNLQGVVETVSFLGKTTRYEVNVKGATIMVETSKHPGIKPQDCVSVHIPPEDIIVYARSALADGEITVI